MSQKSQLPFLLDLLDDDSEEIRHQVINELLSYGYSLEDDIKEVTAKSFHGDPESLHEIILKNRRDWIREEWHKMLKIENEHEQLEAAFDLIAKFQDGFSVGDKLAKELDRLAEEFHTSFPGGNELDLSNYLFKTKKLEGEKHNYYDPRNSNMLYVINEKKGLPITLACILILVSNRRGLRVEGCNFPGHFLAKVRFEKEIILVDCYNKGRFIHENDVELNVGDSLDAIHKIIRMKVTSKQIIKRVLTNLINAYQHDKNDTDRDLMNELLLISSY